MGFNSMYMKFNEIKMNRFTEVIISIFLLSILFFPYISNNFVFSSIITIIKIITSLFIIYLLFKNVLGQFNLLVLTAIVSYIYYNFIFDAKEINIIYNFQLSYFAALRICFQYITRYCSIIFISLIMFINILKITYTLFNEYNLQYIEIEKKSKFYNNIRKKIFKFRIVLPIIGYLIMMFTIIQSYAGIYNSYYTNNINEYKKLIDISYKYYIEYDDFKDGTSTGTFYLLDKKNDGKLRKVKKVVCYYEGKIKLDNTFDNQKQNINEARMTKIHSFLMYTVPDSIRITNYDDNQNEDILGERIIDKGFKFCNDNMDTLLPYYENTFSMSDTLSELLSNKPIFTYFSIITFFTIGFGDIIPTNHVTRWFVNSEIILSHILSIIFIPIIVSIVMVLYKQLNEKNKSSNNVTNNLENKYCDDYNNVILKVNKKYKIQVKKLKK